MSYQLSPNLLGIEPYLVPADYASEAALYSRLDSYLEAASHQGWLSDQTIAVFPEYIGTWLAVTGEGDAPSRARILNSAMARVVLRRPIPFLRELLAGFQKRRENRDTGTRGQGDADESRISILDSRIKKDRVTIALLRLKAGRMASLYQSIFSRLASTYRITLVAGSILLPSPSVQDGQVTAGRGPVYNISAVFDPHGCAHASLATKAFPIARELPFVTPGRVSDLPAFDTPAGRLGVLVCADSWYPQAYAQLRALGADWIAVPSALFAADWEKPWGGYTQGTTPPDVDPRDAGRLTEGEAWQRYSLPGRMALSGARTGINVFLKGKLWDLGSLGGYAQLIPAHKVVTIPSLYNLWLE